MKLASLLATLTLASLTACTAAPTTAAPKHTFAIGTNDFLLDGQRFQIRCGEEMCATLRVNCMVVGAFGNCGEFATIKSQADEAPNL